ncbi:MAG: GHKL domain-containing protein [Flavobacteriales bacterium]|nr:GHKL domain-containing protein [Flavobacteriales bacterium]
MRKLLFFLGITLAIGLFASYQGKRMAHQIEQHSAEEIQADILALDASIQAQLNEINESDISLQSLCGKWEKKGVGFVIYNDKQVADWTTSGIPFDVEFDSRQPPKQGIINLKNSWYLSRSIQNGEQLLVAYALLRTNYDFENRYISNRWSPSVRADSRFTFTNLDSENPIQLTDGPSQIGLRFVPNAVRADISWNSFAWLIFLLLLLLTLWHVGNWLDEVTSPRIGTVAFVLISAFARILMLWIQLPQGVYNLELFGPTQHATSIFIPSLGDFILHLAFLLLMALRLSRIHFRLTNVWLQKVVAVGIPVLLIVPVHYLFEILVVNSSFSLNLNSPFSLDRYSFIGLFASFLILLNYHIIFRALFNLLDAGQQTLKGIFIPMTLSVLVVVLVLGANQHAIILSIATGVVLSFLMLTLNWTKDKIGIYRHAPSVLAFSILASVMFIGENTINEHELRIGMARKIDQQQDPITEYLFGDLATEIRTNRKLRLSLTSAPVDAESALQVLHDKLGYDHWNRYLGIVDVFTNEGGLLVSDRELTGPNYFELQTEYDKSRPTISDGLRYVGDWNTEGGYLARIELEGKRNQKNLVVFVRLIPEKTDDILGFTDLFVSEEISTAKAFEGYSYARYQNGELQEKHGDFAYSLSDHVYNEFDQKNCFFEKDKYSHLVSRPQEGTVVLVSQKSVGIVGYLTTFSYLFFLYLICSILASLISGQLVAGIWGKKSFSNRINLAMSAVSFISLLLIGLLTVYYVIREYNGRNEEMISEKSKSVLIELEHKLRDRQSFDEEDKPMLSALLAKFSKVFFTDINLYHLDGRLLATSRPRLFDEGLMAEVIDPSAYTQMRFEQKSSFIQEETIGNLSYLTAYVPFRNEKREVVAFMSLPYFARQYGLQQEIFSLLAALTNIYVFLILISVMLALFVSNRITEPLRFIREGLKNLKLDEANRAIEWNSKDEIGELVEEYNRTLNELVRSAELLAKSERESAWREMAKQVAHEIKNPLTPMKLSIQMLQRSKNDGVEDLSERIDKVTATLIEQIDTLSNIASEFSSFAQMPKSNIEKVDLKQLLERVAELYRNSEAEIELNLQVDSNATIQADKEQLLRVFNNLIKNGIQAVQDDIKPKITVSLTRENDHWIASVRDNGSGISEDLRDRIFVPNFTTKSSGMGLGLAMVKNIVESANGKIWFESEPDNGTVFYTSFPSI